MACVWSSAGDQPLVMRFLRYTAAAYVSELWEKAQVGDLLDCLTPGSCSTSSMFASASGKPGCSSAYLRSNSAWRRMSALGSSVAAILSRSVAMSQTAESNGRVAARYPFVFCCVDKTPVLDGQFPLSWGFLPGTRKSGGKGELHNSAMKTWQRSLRPFDRVNQRVKCQETEQWWRRPPTLGGKRIGGRWKSRCAQVNAWITG